MTLVEAIKQLTEWQKGNLITSFEDVDEATTLGIEALKLLYEHRNEYYFRYDLPLPSETED